MKNFAVKLMSRCHGNLLFVTASILLTILVTASLIVILLTASLIVILLDRFSICNLA